MVDLMVIGEHLSEISFSAESCLPIVFAPTQVSNSPALFMEIYIVDLIMVIGEH